MTLDAFFNPEAIQIDSSLPPTLTVASLIPSSYPLSQLIFHGASPSSHTPAVRIAAYITPPVCAKISAAPVDSPSGESNVPSGRFRISKP